MHACKYIKAVPRKRSLEAGSLTFKKNLSDQDQKHQFGIFIFFAKGAKFRDTHSTRQSVNFTHV